MEENQKWMGGWMWVPMDYAEFRAKKRKKKRKKRANTNREHIYPKEAEGEENRRSTLIGVCTRQSLSRDKGSLVSPGQGRS